MTKDELIEKHRNINVGNGWWDATYTDFIERMEEVGIKLDKDDVTFTGFSNQGDGACFLTPTCTLQGLHVAACTWLDTRRKEYLATNEQGEEELRGGALIAAIDAWCQHMSSTFLAYRFNPRMKAVLEETCVYVGLAPGHYAHSGMMRLHHGSRLYDDLCLAILNAIDFDAMQSRLCEIANALYRTLEEEYEYQTSDEAVWETIQVNGLDAGLDEDEAVPTNEEMHPCCD